MDSTRLGDTEDTEDTDAEDTGAPEDERGRGDEGEDEAALSADGDQPPPQDETAESADDPEEAPAGGSEAGTAGPGPRSRGWLTSMVVLLVVLVISLVVGGIKLHSVLDYRAATDRREAILSVSRDVAQRSYALDYESFPKQSSEIISRTTGRYRQGLVNASKGLQDLLKKGKVKSTCTITATGIERADENSATVLFSINSRVTNTEVKAPKVRSYRVAMQLTRQDDKWLVASNNVIA